MGTLGTLVKSARWEDPGVTGVGAVRVVGAGPVSIAREEVTLHDPPSRHGYTIVGDRPARDYQALLELTPRGSRTHLTWTGGFEPHPRALGPLVQRFFSWYVGRLADAAIREARRRQAGGSVG